MKKPILLALIVAISGCVSQIPKSYTWRKVDCEYHRESLDVKATCQFEGTVELKRSELGNVFD